MRPALALTTTANATALSETGDADAIVESLQDVRLTVGPDGVRVAAHVVWTLSAPRHQPWDAASRLVA